VRRRWRWPTSCRASRRSIAPRVDYDPTRDSAQRRAELLQCRQDTAEVVLRLRPRPAPVMVPVTVASALTTGLLWMALARLGELDGQTSAALLLLFPAVLAAFLARAGEHAFATRLLTGVRWTTLLVAACALVAVGVIGGGFVRDDSRARASAITCMPRNAGTGKPRRAFRMVRLTCRAHPPARAPVADGARDAVLAGALAASGLTAVLLAGLVRTSATSRRRRAAGDRESQRATLPDGSPLPRAP
jgi:hypothetical protein